MPKKGVYFSKVRISDTEHIYAGISNVGCKPTVSDAAEMSVETFIYDFDQDVYGENIEVELHSFLRPEMKFDSLEALKAQLKEDMEAGRCWHTKYKESIGNE